MAKKRKAHIGRIILIIFLLLVIIAGGIFLYFMLNQKEEVPFDINSLHINEIDYSEAKTLDLELNSKEYLLMRLNDFKVLYASKNAERIYPASLTKVLTMDSILSICDYPDIDTSSFTQRQWNALIEENASIAGLYSDVDYTISELLYSLILPSGGDAAVALSNYAEAKGEDLIELMNAKCNELGLNNSHFTNPTGLHDDELYTSIDDYSKIVIDTLLNKKGKEVIKTMEYELDDYHKFKSTLFELSKREDNVKVYGGKTGFTLEAGMNIMVLYETNNRSYLLILANAPGSPYVDGQKHIEDVNNIFKFLYN